MSRRRRVYPEHVYAVAGRAGCGVQAAANVYAGRLSRPTTHEAVRQAALALGITEPPGWREQATEPA